MRDREERSRRDREVRRPGGSWRGPYQNRAGGAFCEGLSFGSLRDLRRRLGANRACRPIETFGPVVGKPLYRDIQSTHADVRPFTNLTDPLAVTEHPRRQRRLRDPGGAAIGFGK